MASSDVTGRVACRTTHGGGEKQSNPGSSRTVTWASLKGGDYASPDSDLSDPSGHSVAAIRVIRRVLRRRKAAARRPGGVRRRVGPGRLGRWRLGRCTPHGRAIRQRWRARHWRQSCRWRHPHWRCDRRGGTNRPDGGVVLTPTACSTGTAQTGDVTVSLSGLQQKITGFGVSFAWAGSYQKCVGCRLSLVHHQGGGPDVAPRPIWRRAVHCQIRRSEWRHRVDDALGDRHQGSPGGSFTVTQTNPNGCKASVPVLTNPQGLASALVTWVKTQKPRACQSTPCPRETSRQLRYQQHDLLLGGTNGRLDSTSSVLPCQPSA